MEVVGGGPSPLVVWHETAPIASRSSAAGAASSMDADPYFVQPAAAPQMQMQLQRQQQQQQQQQQLAQRYAQQQAQWRSSSTPIECTASGSLTVQWQASTADPLFKALQTMFTRRTMFTAAPARGVKRAVLQDWNCADSPSLKRFRFEGESYATRGSNPRLAGFARDHRGPTRHSAPDRSATHPLEPRL